jgi:hypothetical protein
MCSDQVGARNVFGSGHDWFLKATHEYSPDRKACALGDFGYGNTRRREQPVRILQPRLQGFFHQVNRQNGSEIGARRLCVTSATPAVPKIVRLASA